MKLRTFTLLALLALVAPLAACGGSPSPTVPVPATEEATPTAVAAVPATPDPTATAAARSFNQAV